jgi:hypothetical protein
MRSLFYRGAARPGRKQATATEDFGFIYPIYNHNWRNILTIKVQGEVGRAKDLSAPLQVATC